MRPPWGKGAQPLKRTIVHRDYEECDMQAACMLAIDNDNDVDFVHEPIEVLTTKAPPDEEKD